MLTTKSVFYQAARAERFAPDRAGCNAQIHGALGRIDDLASVTFRGEQQASRVFMRHVLLADGFDRKLLHNLAIAHYRDSLA